MFALLGFGMTFAEAGPRTVFRRFCAIHTYFNGLAALLTIYSNALAACYACTLLRTVPLITLLLRVSRKELPATYRANSHGICPSLIIAVPRTILAEGFAGLYMKRLAAVLTHLVNTVPLGLVSTPTRTILPTPRRIGLEFPPALRTNNRDLRHHSIFLKQGAPGKKAVLVSVPLSRRGHGNKKTATA